MLESVNFVNEFVRNKATKFSPSLLVTNEPKACPPGPFLLSLLAIAYGMKKILFVMWHMLSNLTLEHVSLISEL